MKPLHTLTPMLLLLLAACQGKSDDAYQLRGQLTGMTSGELYVYADNGLSTRFDTLLIKDGKFAYAGHADQVLPLHIFFPNALEQVVFAGPGEELTYEAAANDLANFRVKGSAENERMNRFREATAKQDTATVRRTAAAYILEDPASPVAIHLLLRYFLAPDAPPSAQRQALLDTLLICQPDNRLLHLAQTRLDAAARTSVGDTLPALAVPLHQAGDTLRLGPGTTGRPLLIAFWASWMPRNWELLTTLRELQRDYDGRLDILAISLDTQRYQWENHLEQDSLALHHACDGCAWTSPYVEPFAISRLPAYVLADSGAVIRQRSQGNTADLKAQVAALMQ